MGSRDALSACSGCESSDTTVISPDRIVMQPAGCSEAQKWQRGLPRMKHRPHGSTPQKLGLTNDQTSPIRQEIKTWHTVPCTNSPTPPSTLPEADIFETIASAELVFPDKDFDEFGRSTSFAVSTTSVEKEHNVPQVQSLPVN